MPFTEGLARQRFAVADSLSVLVFALWFACRQNTTITGCTVRFRWLPHHKRVTGSVPVWFVHAATRSTGTKRLLHHTRANYAHAYAGWPFLVVLGVVKVVAIAESVGSVNIGFEIVASLLFGAEAQL